MKKIIYLIILITTLTIFGGNIYSSPIYFTYSKKSGTDSYYNSVIVKSIILNFNKKIKSIDYCFTTEDYCNDFLNSEVDVNKRIINLNISYPEYEEKKHICIKITDVNGKVNKYCDEKYYLVDASLPVIKPKYEVIIQNNKNEELDYKSMYEVKSKIGILSFNCEVKNKSIYNSKVVCTAKSKNGLESISEQTIYYNNKHKLEGKKILFIGDSITAATYEKYGGWASRVGFANFMDWENYGINGATISHSNKSIIDQVEKTKDQEYDYIIVQGGINDASRGVENGEIADSKRVDEFDTDTYAGGLEEIFYYLRKYHKDAKIGYILTYSTPKAKNQKTVDRDKQIELGKEIANKWDIPYLDLYSGKVYENKKSISYSELLDVENGSCFRNEDMYEIHLNGKGYDILSKYISIWVSNL